jgi:hypothetical protein
MIALALFVAAAGVAFLASALANWDWYKGIVDFALVEGLLGESAARWLCGLSGVALIGFGAVLLFRRSQRAGNPGLYLTGGISLAPPVRQLPPPAPTARHSL